MQWGDMSARYRAAATLAALGIVITATAFTVNSESASAVTAATEAGSTQLSATRAISVKQPVKVTTASAATTTCPKAKTSSSSTQLQSLGNRKIDDSVPLYLDQLSARCGDTITIHAASTYKTTAVIRAYRIGWYGGDGSRLIWSSAPVRIHGTTMATHSQPLIPSPNWPVTIKVAIDTTWTPGLYAIASTVGGRITGVAELVVRSSTPAARAVVIYSGLTNASYSPFGGASLYRGLDGGSLALSVSLRRPLVLNGRGAFTKYDIPTAQVLDRVGINVDPVMDTDVNATSSLLTARTLIVLPGHSEYWTKTMYDGLLAAQSSGTNIVVMGANEIYWQTRVQANKLGEPVSMFVARSLAKDPLASSTPKLATVRWRDAPLLNDPSGWLGESYTVTRAKGSLQILSVPTWLANVPELRKGAILQGVAAGEVDGPQVTASISIPSKLQVIGLGLLKGANGKTASAGMTYYTAPSGSAVFQFGSTNWGCQLMASCPDGITSWSTRQTQWAITKTVLRSLIQRTWGRAHPSVPNAPRSITAMNHTLSAAAYGTFGTGD